MNAHTQDLETQAIFRKCLNHFDQQQHQDMAGAITAAVEAGDITKEQGDTARKAERMFFRVAMYERTGSATECSGMRELLTQLGISAGRPFQRVYYANWKYRFDILANYCRSK